MGKEPSVRLASDGAGGAHPAGAASPAIAFASAMAPDIGPEACLRVVVMGVAGCGKSTLGIALAQHLGLPFVEGDALHPPANVARMAAGIPLTDDDRWGWLDAIALVLAKAGQPAAGQGAGVIVTCSALKLVYRNRLRAAAPDVRFIHLTASPELLAQRLCNRQGHYMPASLLQSQLDTLEPPTNTEALTLDLSTEPPPSTAQLVLAAARYLTPSAAVGASPAA